MSKINVQLFDIRSVAAATKQALETTSLNALEVTNESLRQILLEMGVKPAHVETAMQRVNQTHESLAQVMRDFGFLSGEGVAQALSRQTGLDYFSPQDLESVDSARLAEIPVPSFKEYLPVGFEGDRVLIAVPDPTMASDASNAFRSYITKTVIASEYTIQTAYRRYFSKTEQAFDSAVEAFEEARARTTALRAANSDDKQLDDDEQVAQPLRDVYIALLRHACYSGASDLYLNCSKYVGVIRLKLNGVGTIFRTISIALYNRILNKMVQENSKAEDVKRRPRETTVQLSEEERRIHSDIAERFYMRLELAESRGVFSAVIRIQDGSSNSADLERVGLDDDTYQKLLKVSRSPTGFFIVTGPTGSGKTTTMYALIKKIDPVERSIQSIENPIEFDYGLWDQFQIRRDAQDEGQEYEEWLKALLRNAPDVIMIGEVRDHKVARICLNAANTGHLVFASLHTNTSAMAISRLKDLQVDMGVLSSVLLGIMGQRLVRVLCNHCKQLDTSVETQTKLNIFNKALDKDIQVYTAYKAGDGCPNCNHSGYRGRHMVYELFEMTADTRRLLEKNGSPTEIALNGMPGDKSMYACGLKLVQTGITSMEELETRVPPTEVEVWLRHIELTKQAARTIPQEYQIAAEPHPSSEVVKNYDEELAIFEQVRKQQKSVPQQSKPTVAKNVPPSVGQLHQAAISHHVNKKAPQTEEPDATPEVAQPALVVEDVPEVKNSTSLSPSAVLKGLMTALETDAVVTPLATTEEPVAAAKEQAPLTTEPQDKANNKSRNRNRQRYHHRKS